jgi:hypothetical protein
MTRKYLGDAWKDPLVKGLTSLAATELRASDKLAVMIAGEALPAFVGAAWLAYSFVETAGDLRDCAAECGCRSPAAQ